MVTMGDVAARAGVSQATVSFVLGGRADRQKISRETRDRVTKAADELAYQRNQLARAMVTGKSRIIGVLTTQQSGDNIVRILTGAMEVASENDYLLKVVHLSYSGVDDSTIARCLEWRLAGAIVIGFSEETHFRLDDALRENNIPVSLVDNVPPVAWGIRIGSDDEQGIRASVSHLTALGHRRIAFVGGRHGSLSEWREQSFREAMTDAGLLIPPHWIQHTSWSDQEVIERGVRALFEESGDHLPTAVVCSADTVAMVVLRIARSLGLRLPEDLSVTGYSNATHSSFVDPPLTTVDQSFHEMGRAAALRIIERVDNEGADDCATSGKLLLPIRFIERGSTAPPRPERE